MIRSVRMRSVRMMLAVVACAAMVAHAQESKKPKGEGLGAGESANGLDMQHARARMMTARGMKMAYTEKFDLSGLLEYKPVDKLSGIIRMWGSNYFTDGRIGGLWEDAFRKMYPDVTFEWHMETTSAAVPSLVFGVSDMGIGRKVTFSESQLYERYQNHDPLELDIATGSYNVPGWNPGFGVIVSQDNPLTHITMEQLDGIFGAERNGGWEGTSWHAEWGRGPEKNIRIWGQLGLNGEWADKPIVPYGLNLRYHQATEISDMVLKGSDKWNEKLKTYANYVTASGTLSRGMNEDLAADKYGIGIVAADDNVDRRSGAKAESACSSEERWWTICSVHAGNHPGPHVPDVRPYLCVRERGCEDRCRPQGERVSAVHREPAGTGVDSDGWEVSPADCRGFERR